MSQFFRFIPITVLCLLLAACYETFPPVSSAVVTHRQGVKPQGATQQLSPEQIASVSAWLQDHRWGWYPVTATYGPGILILATHADGTFSRINLTQNVLSVGQHQRSLSKEESRELHSMIDTKNDR